MSRIEFPLLPTASETIHAVTSERHRIILVSFSLFSVERSTKSLFGTANHRALKKPIFLKLFRDVNKEIGLNHTQLDLKDIYRKFQNIILGIRVSRREREAEKRIFCLKFLLAWARRCDFESRKSNYCNKCSTALYAKKIFHSLNIAPMNQSARQAGKLARASPRQRAVSSSTPPFRECIQCHRVLPFLRFIYFSFASERRGSSRCAQGPTSADGHLLEPTVDLFRQTRERPSSKHCNSHVKRVLHKTLILSSRWKKRERIRHQLVSSKPDETRNFWQYVFHSHDLAA